MTIEYHSYLIRIWRETSTDLQQLGDWHGEVEQIQCGSCWTIQSVDALLVLIEVQAHELEPGEGGSLEDNG
ncbi:MAG: hypothetical protein K0B06_08790 [Brevefilum sp.]|nr:hypothetical protein [Brevefilum sp.]